jgi:DNA-binding MltR family transcriptional regulator
MAKGLKKFAKERPTTEEIAQMFSEIRSDAPRSAVVLAAALIDDVLSGAIRYRMVKLSKDEDDDLFEGNGPLASFSARIRMAYAPGIIGKKTRHDLNVIHEIRNAFAHVRRVMNFDTPEVSTLIKSLHSIKDIENYQSLPIREMFSGATQMMMMHLVTKIGPFPRGTAGVSVVGLKELD